ncbi:MAG: hypothetical protein QXD52_03540, partial [Candidatus Bathyarchaeia archaeon]
SVNLKSLAESLQGTVIYEEALNETMRNDMDVKNTLRVLNDIKTGVLKVVLIEGLNESSPISRLGMERIGRKTDIIPPEKMHRLLIESTRARLMNEVETLVCLEKNDFIGSVRVRDLADGVKCPVCGSTKVGVTHEDAEVVRRILLEKSNRRLSKQEMHIVDYIKESSRVLERYGFTGLVVMAGKRLSVDDIWRILSEESKLSDRLIELIIDAEKKALMKSFW